MVHDVNGPKSLAKGLFPSQEGTGDTRYLSALDPPLVAASTDQMKRSRF